jgi:peptidoglycan-N-acetylglucosamine deacetylase
LSNILTIDLEDWYHLLDYEPTRDISSWDHYEPRIIEMSEFLLKFLRDNNVKATVFILGWIAERYPEVVLEFRDQGHEIGSHSYSHPLLYNLTKSNFRYDLLKSKEILENIVNLSITSYRAPGFSVKDENIWVLDILAEEGFTHDCSIFPARRAHGGLRSSRLIKPFIYTSAHGFSIKCFPMSTFSKFGVRIPYSGGGYFRLLPKLILDLMFQHSDYNMTYFHPRDFDVDQPMLHGLSVFRRFKAYYGINTTKQKLEGLLKSSKFIKLSEYDGTFDKLEYAGK